MPILISALAVCEGPGCGMRLKYEVMAWEPSRGGPPPPPDGWGLWHFEDRTGTCCRACINKLKQGALSPPERARSGGL